jgi:hypothetical protein
MNLGTIDNPVIIDSAESFNRTISMLADSLHFREVKQPETLQIYDEWTNEWMPSKRKYPKADEWAVVEAFPEEPIHQAETDQYNSRMKIKVQPYES